MAAKKFLRLVSGRIQEIVGVITSTGAPNDGDIPALDSTGRLDVSVMPVGVEVESRSMVTSENLAAGDFVNCYLNGGVITARKADATASGKEAFGFVLTASTSPAANVVYFEGINAQLSSLTIGAVYYIDKTTPGGVVSTAPASTGNIVQEIGLAISATEIETKIVGRGIVLA